MSELPGRPNIDQLRRQARDLLRGAADGESSALARIRAVSERVSLSAAQLAVAREYGFASWPALHAEVQRRLAGLPSGEGEPGRKPPGRSVEPPPSRLRQERCIRAGWSQARVMPSWTPR